MYGLNIKFNKPKLKYQQTDRHNTRLILSVYFHSLGKEYNKIIWKKLIVACVLVVNDKESRN